MRDRFSWPGVASLLRTLTRPLLWQTCSLCTRKAHGSFCPDCYRQLLECHSNFWDPQSRLMAWGHYHGTLRRAIAQLKYQNQQVIAQTFGDWLGDQWLQIQPQRHGYQVIPIPLHPQRLQDRGYNQAALIADRFCRNTGLRFNPAGLQRVKATQPQFSLSPSDRFENLRYAFALGSSLATTHRALPILLVDDIYTTGATMKSATIALSQKGFHVAGRLVVAKVVEAGSLAPE
ncbi:ComF family protein [Lyngbya confervoides]|uniref:ComF family protein n=1 Tax=Lyngbya confervoides BDU141951 TaxID=1574623 RepID=A0ABD4T0Q1_9CYAN|nr:ComF family protein [Lyngbya confervoides]MCM1982292.1 ComF family protein [Lyngbya confervoides BDU141951]